MNQDNNQESTQKITIALIVGSLRAASINRKFAEYVVSQFPDNVTVSDVKISDLPLYNSEYDNTPDEPESYSRVRKQVADADLLFIFTPEYNRSIPGGLKNAIDVLSRPFGKAVLQEKKVAIATASPGAYGGRSCAFDLHKVLLPFAAPILQKPEVYLSRADDALDDDGNVSNERTKGFLDKFAAAIVDFAKR